MKHRKLNRKTWLLLAAVAVIVALLATGVTMAMFQTTLTRGAVGEVAAMKVGQTELTLRLGELYPGGSQTYEFAVTNYTDSGLERAVSETPLDYTVAVSDAGNLPLTYSLSCADEQTEGRALSRSGDVWSGGKMDALQEQNHSYILTVFWPAGENDPAYADEIDLIRVTVDAQQRAE